MCMLGQVTESTGANKHGVVVFGHTVRFCIQGVAGVTQQVHDAGMRHVYLPKLEDFPPRRQGGWRDLWGASVLMRGAPSSCGLWRGVIGGAYTGRNAWQIEACFS